MENEIKINNEIAHIIIKLCFSINDLKKHYDPNNKEELQFFTIYEDIQKGMNEIFQATSTSSMLVEIKDTLVLTKNYLKIYKMLPLDFWHRDQIIESLTTIIYQLTEFEKLISN